MKKNSSQELILWSEDNQYTHLFSVASGAWQQSSHHKHGNDSDQNNSPEQPYY